LRIWIPFDKGIGFIEKRLFVTLLMHPLVNFPPEFSKHRSKIGVSGEVVLLFWVGNQIIQLFGRANKNPFD
jgi:hypothetical protein